MAKKAPKASENADLKNNSHELIVAVAGKIVNDPKFIYDANIRMSATAVIARARRDGYSPEQIAKMSARQLQKYLDSQYSRHTQK